MRAQLKIRKQSLGGKHKQNGDTRSCRQQCGITSKGLPERTEAISLANSPRWPVINASMVLGCWLNPNLASVRSVPRLQFPLKPYPSTSWMVQRLTSRRLASSRWLTPLDRSSLMYSRCCPVRSGRLPGKGPSVRALARIHRRTAFGAALEEAKGYSSESGIMVL